MAPGPHSAERAALCRRGVLWLLVLALWLLAACQVTVNTNCQIAPLSLSFEVFTTCNGVFRSDNDRLSWEYKETENTTKKVEQAFTIQANTQGLSIQEMKLFWSPQACTASQQTPLEVKPIGFEWITLAPDTTSTIQRILLCTPSTPKEAPGTLDTNVLFACRKGNESNIECTLQLRRE